MISSSICITPLISYIVYTPITQSSNLRWECFQWVFSITAIGFTTRLEQTTYSSASSIIRGSLILYNGGNAYNGTVFTCPSPGLYLFHVSLCTRTKYGGIWIYKNSQKLTIAYAGYVDPQYNGASVSAAVWLDVGDQVYLRAHTSPILVDNNSVFTGVRVN